MIRKTSTLIIKYSFILFLNFVISNSLYSNERIPVSNFIQVINTFKTDKAIFSSPIATFNDNVIVGSHDKCVYFFSKTGNLLKKYKTDGWVHASPSVLSDSSIAIGSYDGNIYFFNERGNLKRKIKLGCGSVFTSIVELPNKTFINYLVLLLDF